MNEIRLRGTSRRYSFEPGFNVIQGEIASGKSSLMQLIHALFGSPLENLIPEVRQVVTHVEGSLSVGEDGYTISRPLTATATAKVEIAGRNEVARLPVLALDSTADTTYGRWLLDKFGLPAIEIPLSEMRPDSQMSPVSINDYFLYCHLRWNEIDTSVLGHHDAFKNRKRMVVFRILYGLYDADVARLEADLRLASTQLKEWQQRVTLLEQTFAGTVLENRANITRRRDEARQALSALERATSDEAVRVRQEAPNAAGVQRLRSQVLDLDREIVSLRVAHADELRSAEQLERLGEQLLAQSRRLTKSIIADQYLVDFDFLRCPRCNSGINSDRGSGGQCYLCLQEPAPAVSRQDLEREQQRLDRQLAETHELVASHRQTASTLDRALAQAAERRARASAELDFQMSTYVADSAQSLSAGAAERARLQEELERYGDYLQLLDRLESAGTAVGRLEQRVAELRQELGLAESRQADVRERFEFLDNRLERLLEAFNAPRSAERTGAYVDRQTYLPWVDGRPFDNLHSPGLSVQVNVAYILANHLAALNFDLPLPGILLIDGFTSNIGAEGADPDRRRRMYEYLIELSRRRGDQLQVIVADNDVPELARDFVRVTLSQADRLIPIVA